MQYLNTTSTIIPTLKNNKYELLPFYKENIKKLNMLNLSKNPNAISLLEEIYKQNQNQEQDQEQDEIKWYNISKNPNAISLLKELPDNQYRKGLQDLIAYTIERDK